MRSRGGRWQGELSWNANLLVETACMLNLFHRLPFYSSKQMELIIRSQSGRGFGIANLNLLHEPFAQQAAHSGHTSPAAPCIH